MGYTEEFRQGLYGRMPGAYYHAGKVSFLAVSEEKGGCDLLLFQKGKDTAGKRVPMRRIGSGSLFYAELPKRTAETYETYLYENGSGCFCDVYARKVSGRESFGASSGEVRPALPRQEEEEAGTGFDCPAFSSLVFYKLHVRGFTKHASSGVRQKGTFAGLMEKIPYLQELGINAVLLMPVYEFDECMEVSKSRGPLSAKQLAQYEERYGSGFIKAQQAYEQDYEEVRTVEKVNYWGYTGSSNFYFAPKAAYAADTDNAAAELRHCVAALHEAGIAVFFEFFFGAEERQGLILDCLRYWTYAYGADGFHLIGERLPLPLLLEDFSLSGVKLLVTEYDGSVQRISGGFADRRVAVYNDGFRNVMRRFVKGDENMVGEFLDRLRSDAPGVARIQYIADQNGFSLYDLYAYDRKHNEANGERNKDGEDYNYSWNCGVEGETTKKKISLLRARLRKNALATVFLSQSVPLLFAGDEFAHTKKGNNNAYCQDNEVSWLNWRFNKERREGLAFVKELISFRKSHGSLFGARNLRGSDWRGIGLPDISYHGVMLWQPDFASCSRSAAVLLCGGYAEQENEDDVYLLFNMLWEPLCFALPEQTGIYRKTGSWKVALDTSGDCAIARTEEGKQYAFTADCPPGELFCRVPARSVVVLTRSGEL